MIWNNYTNIIKLPKYRRISIMAFVYRSPRRLEQPIPCQHKTDHETQSQQQNSTQKKVVGRIAKGVACRNTREEEKKEKQFYFAKDEQLEQWIKKKQGSRHKEEAGNNRTQYFFKSKSKRGFVNQKNVDICRDKDEIQEEEDIIHKKVKNRKSKKKPKNKQISPVKQQAKSQSLNKRSERKPCLDYQQKKSPFLNKQDRSLVNNINLLNSKKQLYSVFAVPSIPGKEEKFGYVLKQNMLHYPQLVPKSRFEGQKTDFPGPTDYQYTSKKKVKGVLKFNSFSKSNHKKTNEGNSPKQAALLNDQQALKMHNEKIKQWVTIGKEERMNRKKQLHCKKKQREELETRDLSCVSDQSGQTEYEFDTTPGPGHYQFQLANQKKSFRSKNQKYSKIFMSQSSRFCDKAIEEKKWFLKDDNQVKKERQEGQKDGKFFISKLKRDLNLQNKSISPPPGHYDVRVSLQNDVITNIVKNSPKLFDNNLPRLIDPVISISPGPAYYSQSQPNFKVESFQPLYNFNKQNQKKQENKFKTYEEILLHNCPRTNSFEVIHKHENKRADQAKRAPFLSSCPKNVSPNIGYITELPQAPIQSPYKANKENIIPFNCSESKVVNKTAEYRAEVGLYTLESVNGWEKKSYNVIFN